VFRKLLYAFLAFPLLAQPPTIRGTLGSGYVLLGKLVSANLNVTTDQAITVTIPGGASKYQVQSVTITNASTSLGAGLAVGAIYTAASKGGTALYSAATVYTSLTAATAIYNPAITIATSANATTLYFSLTTANGSAATADVYVFGTPLP